MIRIRDYSLVLLMQMLLVLPPVVFASPGEPAVVPGSPQQVRFLGMSSTLPGTWKARTPSSKMRLVQYEISGVSHAEMIVFYFGQGQGGNAGANIARWVEQFRPVNGKPVQPLVNNMTTSGGLDVTWVEIRGDYARGVGMGPVGDYKPDQMLVVAITETPYGNLFIQFHGNHDEIMKHREEFLKFVMALRQDSLPDV